MYIVTAQEMYDIEAHAMQQIGIKSCVLMEKAGSAITEEMLVFLKPADRISVFIGPGNNGGDGYVIARLLLYAGFHVKAVQVVPDEKIKGDALLCKEVFARSGGSIVQAASKEEAESVLQETDIVVDAMLGIGTRGPVREPVKSIIEAINAASVTVFSVDIPSGLSADEGMMQQPAAVKADYTYMLGTLKESAFVPGTAPFYGKWKWLDIGLPPLSLASFARRQLTHAADVKASLPERDAFSHKGTYGKCLIIGGSRLMPGSVTMTARAALQAGAGLAVVGTAKDAIPVIAANCLEATYTEVRSREGVLIEDPSLELDGYRAVAIGPGLGREQATGELVRRIFYKTDATLVMDADALFHAKPFLHEAKTRSAATVITPHPGEMARLLDISVNELLASPFSISREFAARTGCHVILKGRYTIITAPSGSQRVNPTGNPGLAKGGSGDVLTGIVLAQVMQQQDVLQALAAACYLHGLSADLLVEGVHTSRDLLASDVIEGLVLAYRSFL